VRKSILFFDLSTRKEEEKRRRKREPVDTFIVASFNPVKVH